MSRPENQREAQALVDSLSAEVREQVEQAAQTNEDLGSGIQSAHGCSDRPRASCP